MSVTERRESIKDKGFCFNCLCTAHTRNFCPSRNKCMVCDRNHHTMIHIDETKQKRAFTSRSNPRRPSGNTSSDHSITSPKRHESITSHTFKRSNKQRSKINDRLSRRTKTHIFVPTALARILTTKGPEKTRLLLNSGETQTIILKKLVNRLHLHTTKRDGKDYCTLNLQSYHDPSAKIQVVGMVRTQLPINSPKTTTEIKLQSVFDHLCDLADLQFFQPENIEIMLAD